ncbi:PstS family phosphate ABC transporter substrate-binding protein [Campylobacter sp. MIT 97-5078]|uniref:PstS family phosphate ABC transporter substrate-binding protein n=1 Tax=Campylobacter sp. MIT 97-5078 TaxID=1548153 RepID=UPI000512CC36|nr:PstS family phosphate ABC transporter substrate-binding protein [Campylobacter sp. MIT 97-5078]KGI55743.1 phosphate-binding protein [Campylobacter sp. MIT 97-5078]KGI57280.1 phosphate-binding protein [Campylobacter sp. MIT 97-5078]TQR23578.1 phosphate-binding protein [Campylobacter sp. MIT 97-5078]
MKKILALSVVAFSLLQADELKIAGSSTVYPFTSFVAEEYAAVKNTSTPIVESVGTGGGFKVFCEGKTDISNASRVMKPSEFKACQDAGVKDIIGVMIGYDGIVLAQNKANAPLNITLEQLFLALAKEVPQNGKLIPNPYTNWQQINKSLPNRKIAIYGPPSSSGTRDTIEELVLSKISKKFKEYGDQAGKYKSMRQDSAYIPSGENDNLIVSKLSVDKNAFGLFGYGFLASNKDKINAAKIDAVEANEKNIAEGKYELARSLYIYLNAKNPETLEFAKLYISDELAKSGGELEKIGLVPLSDTHLKANQKHLEQKTKLDESLVKANRVF